MPTWLIWSFEEQPEQLLDQVEKQSSQNVNVVR